MSETTTELPLKGAGVEVPRIPEIDKLANDYRILRDERISLLNREVTAKDKLIAALHEHQELCLPDGTIAYRHGDMFVSLEPGKEKLKVEDLSKNDGE